MSGFSLDGVRLHALVEDDAAALGAHHDGVALVEVAVEDGQRERVLEEPLDGPLERPRAVGRVVALARRAAPRRAGVSSRVIRLSASRRRSFSSWIFTIWAISSRPSGWKITISSIRLRNSGRSVCRSVCMMRGRTFSGCSSSLEEVAPEVRGHDDHGVAEVHRAALAVGEPPVVEHLQEHVEHVPVRLLDLVEEDDRVRPPAHRLGELAALVVTHVARGARR